MANVKFEVCCRGIMLKSEKEIFYDGAPIISLKLENDSNISNTSKNDYTKIFLNYTVNEGSMDNETIINICNDEASKLINYLFYSSEASFSLPILESYHLKGQVNISESTNTSIGGSRDLDTLIQNIDSELHDLKLMNNLSSSSHELYRKSKRVNDVIAQFILLYGILTDKYNYQSDVDKAIQSIDPKVIMKLSSKQNGQYETEYTWLRNQIGHPQVSVDLVRLESRIRDNINSFSKIVKKLIM